MIKSIASFTLAMLVAIGCYLWWSDNLSDNGSESLAHFSPTGAAQVETMSTPISPVAIPTAPINSASGSVAANATESLEERNQQIVDSYLDAKLGEALATFNANMAEVSAEDVQEQRAEIAEIKKEALETPIVEPSIEVVEDKFGNKMKKLTYENGVVRYSFL